MQLQQIIDVEQFLIDIEAYQDDINEAMRRQTQMCAFYGIKHSAADKQLARVKLVDKTMRASKSKDVRVALLAAGEKVTVDLVRDTVDLDPAVKAMALVLIDAQEIESVAKIAYYAFRTRSEMLTGLGHMSRAQMRNNLTVSSARDAAQDYRNRRSARSGDAGDQNAGE